MMSDERNGNECLRCRKELDRGLPKPMTISGRSWSWWHTVTQTHRLFMWTVSMTRMITCDITHYPSIFPSKPSPLQFLFSGYAFFADCVSNDAKKNNVEETVLCRLADPRRSTTNPILIGLMKVMSKIVWLRMWNVHRRSNNIIPKCQCKITRVQMPSLQELNKNKLKLPTQLYIHAIKLRFTSISFTTDQRIWKIKIRHLDIPRNYFCKKWIFENSWNWKLQHDVWAEIYSVSVSIHCLWLWVHIKQLWSGNERDDKHT